MDQEAMNRIKGQSKANETDAGNGSKAVCRGSNVLRSPSPNPRRCGRDDRLRCAGS